jgi:hypothetical protein
MLIYKKEGEERWCSRGVEHRGRGCRRQLKAVRRSRDTIPSFVICRRAPARAIGS